MTREICQGITLIMKEQGNKQGKNMEQQNRLTEGCKTLLLLLFFFGFLNLTFKEMNFEHDTYFNWSQ